MIRFWPYPKDDVRRYAYWCPKEKDWFETDECGTYIKGNPSDDKAYLRRIKWINQERLEKLKAKRIKKLIICVAIASASVVPYLWYANYIGVYDPLQLLNQILCSVTNCVCFWVPKGGWP